MRKYPKLSLVGQWKVGVSPAVIDYFKAVFQWSMPQPPGHMDRSSGDLFTAVTISAVWSLAEEKRQEMAEKRWVPGRKCGWSTRWWHSKVWPLVWHHLHTRLWLLKFSTGCAPKHAPGRVRWGEWGWEGKKTHSKTGEKGERRTDRLWTKEMWPREGARKQKPHYSKEERVGIEKGNWKFALAVEKIQVEETLEIGQEMWNTVKSNKTLKFNWAKTQEKGSFFCRKCDDNNNC